MMLFKSFLAGAGLGWMHFRMYSRMLEALVEKPADAPFKRLALGAGAIRQIFTFAAGILLIRGARLDPLTLCGGLLFATVVYRGYLFYRRESLS